MAIRLRLGKPKTIEEQRVSLHVLANFTRQLVTMFDAGLQLVPAFEFYAMGDRTVMGQIAAQCALDMAHGQKLSSSMARFPRVFGGVYVGLIRAGELTGELSPILGKLAELSERQDTFQKKVSSAMVYPAFLTMVGLGCAAAFLFFILPALQPLFTIARVDLPLPTRILVALGALVHHPVFLVGVPLAALLLWLNRFRLVRCVDTTPALSRLVYEFPLELPSIGPMLQKLMAARMLFTLATLLDAGISLVEALEMVAGIAGNPVIARQVRNARTSVQEGVTLADAFYTHSLLTRGAISIIAVGEESSHISEMVRFLARMYEDESDYTLTCLVALIEPLMLAAMGCAAGFLVLASVLPIARVIENL